MWQRFTLYDARVIAHYLGILILLSAAALLIPAAVALFYQEWDPLANYVFAAGFSFCVGAGLRLFRVAPGRLTRQQALAVTGISWIALALLGAIPLFLSGHYSYYYDALFDSVSCYTATGASIISDLDHLSYADNMWRFIMHFSGGLGLVVVALSMGIFGKVADSSLYASEGRSEHVVPNVVQTTRFLAKFAIIIIAVTTVLCSCCLLYSGMDPDRAVLHSLWLSITSFMTAGCTPMSTSVMYYHSLALEGILLVVMLLGGVNFGLYAEVAKGNTDAFRKDIEVRAAAVWLGLVLIVFVAAMCATDSFSNVDALIRRGVFLFVAAATTTGIINVTPDQLTAIFPSGGFFILAIVMAVGASAGSTAGGIKFSRVGVIAKSMFETIKSTVSPDSARIVTNYHHIGRHRLDASLVKEAMTIFVLFVVTYVLGALVGIAYGYDPMAAIFDSISMASNGGITAGVVSAGMPLALQTVYIVEMWAGRLEFVTLIALVIKIWVSMKPRFLNNIFRVR